jgi:hypothetical protein
VGRHQTHRTREGGVCRVHRRRRGAPRPGGLAELVRVGRRPPQPGLGVMHRLLASGGRRWRR